MEQGQSGRLQPRSAAWPRERPVPTAGCHPLPSTPPQPSGTPKAAAPLPLKRAANPYPGVCHSPTGSTEHPPVSPHPLLVSPARGPTCSSLSEYFCGFLLPWLFLRSFFSSAWHLSRESPLLLCSVWYFFSAAWTRQEKVLSLGRSSCHQGVTETSRALGKVGSPRPREQTGDNAVLCVVTCVTAGTRL